MTAGTDNLFPEAHEAPPKKRRKPDKRDQRIHGLSRRGTPRVLSYVERVEAWNNFVLGATEHDLAKRYETSLGRVTEALNIVARELGYPDTHLDPELERFRLIEAGDRMRSALVKCLQDSDVILSELKTARESLAADAEININGKKRVDLKKLTPDQRKAYISLLGARQAEMKVVTSTAAEYRAINQQLADLAGVRKVKPKQDLKKVKTIADKLATMSTEEIRALAGNGAAQEKPIDIQAEEAEEPAQETDIEEADRHDMH